MAECAYLHFPVVCLLLSPHPLPNPNASSSRNYVNKDTAERFNLTFAGPDTFILRADHTTPLDPAGPGRSSVRLKSVMKYLNHVAM